MLDLHKYLDEIQSEKYHERKRDVYLEGSFIRESKHNRLGERSRLMWCQVNLNVKHGQKPLRLKAEIFYREQMLYDL